jgi:hypothetical protein
MNCFSADLPVLALVVQGSNTNQKCEKVSALWLKLHPMRKEREDGIAKKFLVFFFLTDSYKWQ